MKKIKFILPVCLGLTALVACNQGRSQPESNFYKISFINQATYTTDVDKPELTFESSNLIEKGKDCDLLIRLAPFSTFNELEEGTKKYVEIRQSSLDGNGKILNEKNYSVSKVETGCVYRLQIPKEYMTTSYDVFVNYTYISGEYNSRNVVVDDSIEDNVNVVITNSSVNYDFTFHIMPNNFQAGETFDATTKDKIKIIGFKDGSETDLTPYLSRKELVHIDSSIQGISHYHTDAKSLRCAIPMEYLYEPDPEAEFGYKKKYDQIKITTEEASSPVSFDKERYLSLFDAQVDSASCELTSVEIDDNLHYKAIFVAKDYYYFYSLSSDYFCLTDLTIQPGIYAPTGHPYFRSFSIHKDKSKQGDIVFSPYNAYYGDLYPDAPWLGLCLYDKLDNIYTEMDSWMNLTITDSGKTLTVDIDIADMVKYTQLPTSTIISALDLSGYGTSYRAFYSGGSIDFIKSIDFKVAAY